MNVCTKCEELPSRCFRDITFTRLCEVTVTWLSPGECVYQMWWNSLLELLINWQRKAMWPLTTKMCWILNYEFQICVVNTVLLLMFSVTHDIYCTSVLPGRGISHNWFSLRFLRFFGVVFPDSCLGLRAQDVTPCNYKNCNLWIWAI